MRGASVAGASVQQLVHTFSPIKLPKRTGDSTVRQELPEEGKRKKNASPARQGMPVRTAKKTTQPETDETDPSPPKRSRLRTTSNFKLNSIQTNKEKKTKEDKLKETSSPDEIDETDPSPPKRSRLRTTSNSKHNSIQINKEKKTKEDKLQEKSSPDEDEDSEEETKWPRRQSLETKPEDVFTNQSATTCVSVFKESDSWV